MAPDERHECEIEYKTVSDMDIRPSACIACGFETLIRRSYKFIDHQDLGTPRVKRILRHERVLWECKRCGKQFTIRNPRVLFDSEYTFDVKEYVLMRVLEKGDSMHRVVSDLATMHHVTIKAPTIHAWIDEKKAHDANGDKMDTDLAIIEHSGALSLDATFKAVRVKKSQRKTNLEGHS